MDDLLTLIDDYEPILKDEFLTATEDARNNIEQFISENYPLDAELLPLTSGINETVTNELTTQLSQGFEEKLTALSDKSEIPIILLLSVLNFKQNLNISLSIKSEINQIISESRKAVQIAGITKTRILESIGLTPNQARSLSTYRNQLETIAQQKSPTGILSTDAMRNLSASQRSVIRQALSRGIEPQDVDALVSKQQRALLTHRARAIGRNLSSKIAHSAQQGVIDFAVNADLVKPDQYKRFWVTAHDEKVRHAHSAVVGMNPQGVNLNEPFNTPFGQIMFPPLEINCRCHVSVKKS